MRRKIPESTLPKLNRSQMITSEGFQKLREEHDHLWRVERPDVTAKVTWAASLGDRSENADYHYNKKRLREIDNRVRYLCKCIDDFKVIEYHPSQAGKVSFGAWVEIKNEEKGFQNRFRIVGYEELIGNKDYISMDSPMAKALLDKTVGDEAIVKTKMGDFVWMTKIVKLNNKWYLFYIAGNKWIIDNEKPEPVYKIRMAVSKDGLNWVKHNKDLLANVLEENEAQATLL